MKQECIPVGCVPFAAVAVSRGGVSAFGPGGGLLLVPGVGGVSQHALGQTPLLWTDRQA